MEQTVNDWEAAAAKDEDEFELIPEGEYVAALVSAVVSPAGKYDANVNFEFVIQHGALQGRKVWDRCVLSPKQLWKLKRNLKQLDAVEALDVVKASKSPDDVVEKLPSLLELVLDKVVAVTVVHNEWKDRVYDNVDKISTAEEDIARLKRLDSGEDDVTF